MVVNAKQKDKNVSLILAHDENEILMYQFFKGGIDAKEFRCFVIELLKHYKLKDLKPSEYVLFMDNCRIHSAEVNQDFKYHVEFFLNCPYSPFLNPIEEIFGYIKHKFRIINRSEIDPESIFDNIDLVIKSVSREKIVKFVAHSISFAIKGLKKEPIY